MNRYFILCLMGLSLSLMAAESLMPTKQATVGLNKALNALKIAGIRDIALPAVVPTPTANAHYFTSTALKPNRVDYSVSFDNTVDCRGAQYCSAGSFSTETQGNPTIYFDRENQEITQKISLDKGHSVYYTPSHAMGSFWPGRVEWRCGPKLYTLSWALAKNEEQSVLVKMARSVHPC